MCIGHSNRLQFFFVDDDILETIQSVPPLNVFPPGGIVPLCAAYADDNDRTPQLVCTTLHDITGGSTFVIIDNTRDDRLFILDRIIGLSQVYLSTPPGVITNIADEGRFGVSLVTDYFKDMVQQPNGDILVLATLNEHSVIFRVRLYSLARVSVTIAFSLREEYHKMVLMGPHEHYTTRLILFRFLSAPRPSYHIWTNSEGKTEEGYISIEYNPATNMGLLDANRLLCEVFQGYARDSHPGFYIGTLCDGVLESDMVTLDFDANSRPELKKWVVSSTKCGTFLFDITSTGIYRYRLEYPITLTNTKRRRLEYVGSTHSRPQ